MRQQLFKIPNAEIFDNLKKNLLLKRYAKILQFRDLVNRNEIKKNFNNFNFKVQNGILKSRIPQNVKYYYNNVMQ